MIIIAAVVVVVAAKNIPKVVLRNDAVDNSWPDKNPAPFRLLRPDCSENPTDNLRYCCCLNDLF